MNNVTFCMNCGCKGTIGEIQERRKGAMSCCPEREEVKVPRQEFFDFLESNKIITLGIEDVMKDVKLYMKTEKRIEVNGVELLVSGRDDPKDVRGELPFWEFSGVICRQ